MDGIDQGRPEQRWFAALDDFQVVTDEIKAEADAARTQVERFLIELSIGLDRVPRSAPDLRASVDQVRDRFGQVVTGAIQRWKAEELARELADALHDRLVLLVYGKVNAGKSSLMNFIVKRAAAHGMQARRFRLEGGDRVELDREFATGATETTACIQGVEIGERLILLDSPGLHSVTPVNEALTKRFVAAADGALLLTNSGSPGQVQELELLAGALRESTRPIICVITRSDENEPDEVDGEVVDRFVNKAPERRRLQEQDVLARGLDQALRLGGGEDARARLRPPVSVSVLCADQAGSTPQALAEAGLDRLYDVLAELANEALGYKRQKPMELVREHERQLQHRVQEDVLPALAKARGVGQNVLAELGGQTPGIVDALTGRGLMVLFEALQRHQHDRDVAAALTEVQAALHEALVERMRPLMEKYQAELGQVLVDIDPQGLGGYEEEFVSFEQISGSGFKALGSTAGALGGAAAGALLGSAVPLIGTAIGSAAGAFLGGWLGGAAGGLGVQTHEVKALIGVSFDQLQAKAEPRMRKAVEAAVKALRQRCAEAVRAVDENLLVIEQQLRAFAYPHPAAAGGEQLGNGGLNRDRVH